MKSLVPLIIILWVLCMVAGSLQYTFSQKPNRNSVMGNISNLTKRGQILQDYYKSFPSKHNSDQINDIIYHLYEDYLHSDKNEISHYQDIAVLIDFICSNKFYENSIKACDIITEFPIE